MKIEEYYEILHYLPRSTVDRQYPVDFSNPRVVDGSAVYRTISKNYNGIDLVEMYVDLPTGVDVTSFNLIFSPTSDGNTTLLSLNPNEVEVVEDSITVLQFDVDNNATMTDKSKLLTGIESIKVDFGNIEATIINIVFKSRDYTYTWEDIASAYEDGEDYVLRRLNNRANEIGEIRKIPKILQKYVYMSGGAFAWLTRWEYESKPMKEPKSESNNYADRLLGQVDTAIRNYLSNIENNRDEEYVNMDFVQSTKVGWGSHYGYW